MKRTLTFVLVFGLILNLLAFGPMAMAEDEELPEITWLRAASSNTPEDNNLVLQEFSARLGIRVNIVMANEYDTKLTALIASHDLPDLFSVSAADGKQLVEEGMILPLDDLLEEYGPHILAEVGERLGTNEVNNEYGKTYQIFTNYQNPVCNFTFRVDWLKKLDMELPTNLDELYDVLYAFTYNDPDGNGADDTVGTVLTLDDTRPWEPIFGAYGIAYDASTLLEDGTVTTYMKDPHYLECVEYLRKLYQDGLIDPEFATMPQMTAFEALWTGRCGAFGFQSLGTTNNWYPGRYTFECPADPAEVFGFALLTGPYGDSGEPMRYSNPNGGYVVSAACKNPEAVIKFLDYMFSEEGDELTYLGVEGVMWEWVDEANGKYQRLPGYEDDAAHRAAGGFVYNIHAPAMNTELKLLNKLTQEGQKMDRENAFAWPFIASTFEAETEYGTTLKQITKEALAQLIVTTGDVEAEYAEFVAKWENEGGLAWEEQATELYNKFN